MVQTNFDKFYNQFALLFMDMSLSKVKYFNLSFMLNHLIKLCYKYLYVWFLHVNHGCFVYKSLGLFVDSLVANNCAI